MKLLLVNAFVAVIFIVNGLAQITVTETTLKSWLGLQQVVEMDTTGSVSVNVGTAGENQVWDFSGLTAQDFTATYELFNSANTPYASLYPGANYALKVEFQSVFGLASMYQYINLAPDKLQTVGTVLVSDSDVIQNDDENDVTPLPITYGSSWQSTSADTIDLGVGKMITTMSEKITVDAWGTIKLPSGEYPCLRWKNESTTEQVTRIGDVEVPMYQSTLIGYTWIGENSLLLASATSMENEVDPNFSTASEVMWLRQVVPSTRVLSSSEQVPRDFGLENYPNPFNPATTISFQLPSDDNVTLSIFDSNGRLIRQLVAQSLSTGQHRAAWDGTDESGAQVAGGIYFCRLTTSSSQDVRKMTLLK
ncbi:T9SS type A sorting domain-containing protein [candidate division KSB1 bacterium]|nr:T9SS type A sorting domain-containing protein [candidate division KSB1 bacterium]